MKIDYTDIVLLNSERKEKIPDIMYLIKMKIQYV